ncbi:hypothetical protein EB796_021649 [Bugula neritina]|uniref:C2H2-type domain-containing protein n=1 Tax=Bugula neritina TaxID=10212 RepID=A0A7J7J2V7_BUGNE|nr:hypothetical protein EB796_021649 [Bugula neritina]
MPKAFLVTNRRYGIENGGKNSSNDCTKDLNRKKTQRRGNMWGLYHQHYYPSQNELSNTFVTMATHYKKAPKLRFDSIFSPENISKEALLQPIDLSLKARNPSSGDSLLTNISGKDNSTNSKNKGTDESKKSVNNHKPHEEQIDGDYQCTLCTKQYSSSSNLARHKQIHRNMTMYISLRYLKNFLKIAYLHYIIN